MSTRSIAEMLPALDHLRKHPLMYIGIDVPDAQIYLTGLMHAFSLVYPESNLHATYVEVLKEHGWWHSTTPAWELMKQQGLSDDDIMQRLLDMHYEAWKRVAESLQPETTTTGNGVPK